MSSSKYHHAAADGHVEPAALAVKKNSCWDQNWDYREKAGVGSKQETLKSRVEHQIVLIRHGQYESADSDFERVLTALGREQATRAGERLKELVDAGAIHPIKYVFYSPMQRATETHSFIQRHLPDTIKPQHIKPCSMIMEGAVRRPVPAHSSWKPSDEQFLKDGARVEAAFLNHVHRADEKEENNYSTVIVCHANVIRYFAMRALQLPTDAWLRTSLANASMTIIDISPTGSVSLRCLGESGFLEAKNVTFN